MMLTRIHRAAAVLAFAPVLLAGCGSSGSVPEFCAVYQQLDDADSDDRDYLPLVDALVDVAPTDRVESAAEVLQTVVAFYEDNGRRDLSWLPQASQDRVQDSAEYIENYSDQVCR